MKALRRLYGRVLVPIALGGVFILLPGFAGGCGPKVSGPDAVERFAQAGPIEAEKKFVGPGGIRLMGPYRVVPGDILELQMPAVLRVITSELSDWFKPGNGHKDVDQYLVRVSEKGTITLPIVGDLQVGGKTLSEIENIVIDAYHPKYVVNEPMVVCEVSKYQRESERVFTVMGLVNKPNAFPYPADVQYSLMEALAFAGGLNMVADPRYVKVYRQDSDGHMVTATFGIDSDSLVQTCGIAIKPGDVVYVDHTLRTRMNQFMADVLQIRLGATMVGNSSIN